MPPSRYQIVERGGRLEIIDRETGERPQSAAERMAAHDAAHGNAALRFDRLEEQRAEPPPPAAANAAAAKPTPPSDPIRQRLQEKASPWQAKGESKPPRAKRPAEPPMQRPAQTASSLVKGTFVTGKWWDSKGPRTVSLGEKGKAKLGSGLMAAVIIGFFIMIALIVVQPALLLVAAFALFRFGGTIIGPIGARLIDDAVKADGGMA